MSYAWKAVYNDGTELNKYNPDGTKNAYRDIDREKLQSIEIWNGDALIMRTHIGDNQRLILRGVELINNKGAHNSFILVGKQETINGKNYQGLCLINESDGSMEFGGKFDKNHPWFRPITTFEYEGWHEKSGTE